MILKIIHIFLLCITKTTRLLYSSLRLCSSETPCVLYLSDKPTFSVWECVFIALCHNNYASKYLIKGLSDLYGHLSECPQMHKILMLFLKEILMSGEMLVNKKDNTCSSMERNMSDVATEERDSLAIYLTMIGYAQSTLIHFTKESSL